MGGTFIFRVGGYFLIYPIFYLFLLSYQRFLIVL
nr:MAG TPA: hypothetical protein [Caudoviricetes sp.]